MNENLALPPESPVGTLWATSFEVIPEPAAAGLVLALSAWSCSPDEICSH